MVDHRNASDLMLFHREQSADDIIIVTARKNCGSHHVVDVGTNCVASLSHNLKCKIALRDDTNQFLPQLICYHRHRSHTLASHHPRGLSDIVFRQATDGIFGHDLSTLHVSLLHVATEYKHRPLGGENAFKFAGGLIEGSWILKQDAILP